MCNSYRGKAVLQGLFRKLGWSSRAAPPSVSVVVFWLFLGGYQLHKHIWKAASAFSGGKVVPQQNDLKIWPISIAALCDLESV